MRMSNNCHDYVRIISKLGGKTGEPLQDGSYAAMLHVSMCDYTVDFHVQRTHLLLLRCVQKETSHRNKPETEAQIWMNCELVSCHENGIWVFDALMTRIEGRTSETEHHEVCSQLSSQRWFLYGPLASVCTPSSLAVGVLISLKWSQIFPAAVVLPGLWCKNSADSGLMSGLYCDFMD